MGLQALSNAEIIKICSTINSYSEVFEWASSNPFYLSEDDIDMSYLPQTNPGLGFAVIPMLTNEGFINHLREKFGGNADIMSFVNTQLTLADEKDWEPDIAWSLRFFKDKKFFSTKYVVQSNLTPAVGNTGVNIGVFEGSPVEEPLHQMFSSMR